MNMDIDNDEPAVTQVVSTLTSTHPDVAKLENETRQQQQTIVNMEQQIHTLQQLVQALVQYKTQEEAHKATLGNWQEDMTAKMEEVLSVKHDFRNLMILLQGGKIPLPQPANLSGNAEKGEVITQSQHPDPPPKGSGKIWLNTTNVCQNWESGGRVEGWSVGKEHRNVKRSWKWNSIKKKE